MGGGGRKQGASTPSPPPREGLESTCPLLGQSNSTRAQGVLSPNCEGLTQGGAGMVGLKQPLPGPLESGEEVPSKDAPLLPPQSPKQVPLAPTIAPLHTLPPCWERILLLRGGWAHSG